MDRGPGGAAPSAEAAGPWAVLWTEAAEGTLRGSYGGGWDSEALGEGVTVTNLAEFTQASLRDLQTCLLRATIRTPRPSEDRRSGQGHRAQRRTNWA